MVKVCFIGISLRLEHAAIERLRSEMDVLSEQEPEIEFWFHGFHSDFIKSMLEEVVSLKKRKPNLHIEIVDVVDPIELDAFKKKAQEMVDIFQKDLEVCRQITRDYYVARRLKIRIKEQICRLLSPLLYPGGCVIMGGAMMHLCTNGSNRKV